MHTSFSNTEMKSRGRGRRWPAPSPLPGARSPRVPSQSFLTTAQACAEHKPPRSRQSQNSKRRWRLESYSYSLQHRHGLSLHLRGLKKGFSCGKHLLKGGLWKCPGGFDCLSSGLGVISEFIGERAEMLNRLKFSGCSPTKNCPWAAWLLGALCVFSMEDVFGMVSEYIWTPFYSSA